MRSTCGTTGSLRSFRGEAGSVLIIVAVGMFVLLGVAALAVDVGHLYVVRAELQNAADAAALAGASRLWPHSGPPATSPNWSDAETAATTNAPANQADGSPLTHYTAATGYWNLAHSPYGLQPQGITTTANDAPAVQVTVRKAADNENGGVTNWFATVLGFPTSNVSAVATAVCVSPGKMLPGSLAPIAISKEVYDNLKDTDPPTTVTIGSSYHYPNSMAGQWTSLTEVANDVPFIRDLIENGNDAPIAIGDNIWIQPGVKNTLYENGNQPSVQNNYAGKTIILPVIDAIINDETHGWVPVYGFVGFHVDYAIGGSQKIIVGHFVTNIYTGAGEPAGPNLGVYVPPRLVR